jgi:3D (Asp-Asp-Asp) domain-containing protein
MDKRLKKEVIGGCITMSLLAGVLVGGNEYHNLVTERNGLHDNLNKLEIQHKQDAKLMKKQNEKQTELQNVMQQQLQEMQKMQDQNRSLNQEVDRLQNELNQAKQNQWLSFKATFYDANEPSTGKRPGETGYGITSSGNSVTPGVTVAVDPSVIPLGSWIEVMYSNGTVEKRRADDTGSAIKGQHVDIYVPRATLAMGTDQVKVRILSKPEKI